MKHTALHLAVFGVLAGAALAAQAADVQIYGRVDAGFLYEHKKGEDTFTQKAGGRAHNRIGFNVVEDLGNGVKVKAYLENGFYIDDGQFDDSKVLFNRRSILALQGSLGEIGFGRMGTVQSSQRPKPMFQSAVPERMPLPATFPWSAPQTAPSSSIDPSLVSLTSFGAGRSMMCLTPNSVARLFARLNFF